MLAGTLANAKHLCRNCILQIFNTVKFLENMWISAGVSNFIVNIPIIKSFSRPKDSIFKWWVVIEPI